jgi:hypothetical protein
MATAMDEYAPFDSGAGSSVTEDGWRAMQRRISIAGVVRGQASEMLPFGDSTGMQVKIPAGEVQIESHWGKLTATRTHAVTSNASGSTRYDLVVARANWTTNVVEFDVLAGTPGAGQAPAVTRNTAQWEIPLAVVTVVNGAVTIAAADVKDARQWGGPPVMTTTDDFNYWGDRISSCSRYNIAGASTLTAGQLFIARMTSLGDQTCTKLRLCPSMTTIDPTTSTFLYGGSVDTVHESTIPTTTFRAGEVIVVAVLGLSTSTAGVLITNAVTWSAGNSNTFLNVQSSNLTTAFKAAASMPTSLNLLDGSWNLRDRVFWSALA